MNMPNLKNAYIDKRRDRVFVCGAGHQGLSMAAHLALNSVRVTLWNRTLKNIEEVVKTRKIFCKGIVNGVAEIERASVEISEVISDFVMVTTPSSAHRDIARRLAPYVHKNMVIILNPGRTFGAIDFANTLRQCGVTEMPKIAETQTIVYTCRKNDINSVNIYALKNDVQIAALEREDTEYIMAALPGCLAPYFKAVNSVAITSFSNVGMVLHCAPVLMNVGWIETETVDFKYYYDGISKSIARFLEKIDEERMQIAAEVGCEIESTADWMRRTYNVRGKDLFECIQNNDRYREIDAPPSIFCRYILEDVPNGLVPIEDIGKQMGVLTPNITTIIDLANAVLEQDFRKEGRMVPLESMRDFL